MSFGGNSRAQAFFKQHGWTDGGKIEAKYTSRAAELYKQILSKEVAKTKSMAEEEESGLPSNLPVSSKPINGNGLPHIRTDNPSKKQEAPQISVSVVSIKKPIAAKKPAGRTGGLGARKITTKVTLIFQLI